MSKDPAVLFYSGDFLNGCSDLTMEERGQYITLLCIQHQKGRLTAKNIQLSCGKVSDDVMAKFKIDENGLFYNERMESEAEKRSKYCESRRKNKEKPKQYEHMSNICKTYDEHMIQHMSLHMENENENINRDIIKDDIVIKKGKNIFEKIPETWQPILKEWVDYRNSIKKKLPNIEKTFNQLLKLSNNDLQTATHIIDQSIANGWQGLFEIKQTNQNGTKPTIAERARQSREQAARELANPIVIDPTTDFFSLPKARTDESRKP